MELFVTGASQLRSWLVGALITLLVFPPNIRAQQPEQIKTETLPAVQSLKVIPLAGNGEMNDLERKVMAPLVVQILDQNDRPVEGATVVFRFPLKGPAALFPNQQNSQSFRTDADGQAAASGWTANNEVGNFLIHVSASKGNEIGNATISMTNATRVVGDGKPKHKSWWSSKTAKFVYIGAAAGVAIAVVLITRGGGKSTTSVTAIPGSPTIGGPH